MVLDTFFNLFIKIIFLMFIFERERERERQSVSRGGTERERGRHRIQSRLQAPSCPHRAGRGAQTRGPRDRDLSWSLMLNWAIQAPRTFFQFKTRLVLAIWHTPWKIFVFSLKGEKVVKKKMILCYSSWNAVCIFICRKTVIWRTCLEHCCCLQSLGYHLRKE